MRTKKQWEQVLTEHFNNVNRKLNLDNGKDSQKVFCFDVQKDGKIKAEFLSTKLQNMKSLATDEQYNNEMCRLIKNGNIRFYEEGIVECKVLSFENAEKNAENHKTNDEKLVSIGMGLAAERNGILSKLLNASSSFFSYKTKINLAAQKYFDIYETERCEEIKQELDARQKLEQAMDKEKSTKKIVDNMQAQLSVHKAFENTLSSVFAETATVSSLTEKGYQILEDKLQKLNTNNTPKQHDFITSQNMGYIGLCMAISSEKNTLPPNFMQTALIEKGFAGEFNLETDSILENFIICGRESTAICFEKLKTGDYSALADGLNKAVHTMNEMLGTSLPNKFMDAKPNCLLTAKGIKETMKIINSDNKLKAAVSLSKEDELVANGAIAVWDIAEQSINAQTKLCTASKCNLAEQLPYIELDIKMRGEMFNNAFLSNWYPQCKTNAEKSKISLNELKKTAEVILNARAKDKAESNIALYELGNNSSCFKAIDVKTKLKENLNGKTPQEIMLCFNKLFQDEVKEYSKIKLSAGKDNFDKLKTQKTKAKEIETQEPILT